MALTPKQLNVLFPDEWSSPVQISDLMQMLLKLEAQGYIQDPNNPPAGSGDMNTSVYDTNGNGVVDAVDGWDTKEDDLGDPTVDDQVLSSTIAGVRSWIDSGPVVALQAEVDTGIDVVKYVTPATLADSTQWDDKVITDPTAIAGATAVTNMVQITQVDYDALGTYDSSTFYVITV